MPCDKLGRGHVDRAGNLMKSCSGVLSKDGLSSAVETPSGLRIFLMSRGGDGCNFFM